MLNNVCMLVLFILYLYDSVCSSESLFYIVLCCILFVLGFVEGLWFGGFCVVCVVCVVCVCMGCVCVCMYVCFTVGVRCLYNMMMRVSVFVVDV